MNTRTDVLNFLIETFGYQKYLEIGIEFKNNWEQISCASKTGVEPNPFEDQSNIFLGTSDQFFAQNHDTFDLIFIDGDHNQEQVEKDFENARKVLSRGGSIVFHDATPHSIEYTDSKSCGTVFKALLKIRSMYDFDMCTFSEDHGVCVIRPDVSAEKIECRDLEWQEFYERRVELLNVKNAEEFKTHYL